MAKKDEQVPPSPPGEDEEKKAEAAGSVPTGVETEPKINLSLEATNLETAIPNAEAKASGAAGAPTVDTSEKGDEATTEATDQPGIQPGIVEIVRVVGKERIEGVPAIRGGRHVQLPFDVMQGVFHVSVEDAVDAVRTGAFRVSEDSKVQLKPEVLARFIGLGEPTIVEGGDAK